MPLSTISALSPLDGRYAARLAVLRPLMSEQGYMHRRVQVEVCWFIALSDAGFAEFKPLSPGARTYLLGLVKNFSEGDAAAIKEIGRRRTTTSRRSRLDQVRSGAPRAALDRRIRALRLHQRGHQQHQPRAAAQGGARAGAAARTRW
jgi:hypothetical protein